MAEAANMQAEEPVGAQTTEQTNTSSPTGGSAILRDRFLVDGGEPLSHLDTPHAHAYKALDRTGEYENLFALICTPGMPVRTELMPKLKEVRDKGLLPLVEWGAMDWPALNQRVMCVVYQTPLGGSLSDALASGKTRINEYDVVRRILEPAMMGITTLNAMDTPHRAIRPSNFYFMDENCQEIVLGDCLTASAGFDQPVIFESISRSMANPIGRGIGSVHDDMYALGISLVFILLGFNPAESFDDISLLSMKIERGTYAAVCGNFRLPLSMIEVLRGLLADEEHSRWSPEEVENWIGGRKRTPIQRHGLPKANSPYMFQGHPHISPLTLAYSFAQKPDEAMRTIKSDENFDAWIRKSLGDEDMADRLKAIMEQASSMSGSQVAETDAVISRVCGVLDPNGPIRFKGIAMMPDSLAAELAYEFLIAKNIKPLMELISQEIHEVWYKNNPAKSPDAIFWRRLFHQCRSYLKIEDLGYGIERCLYEANEGMPCQSPLVEGEFITEIEELLPALDRVSNRAEADQRPLDRHITAFIASRFSEDIQPHLKAIASEEEERRIIGTLSLLAFLQWKLKTPPIHGLASWLGGILGPAINTYHSRTTRRELEKEIPQLVRNGSLPELFDLIENAERRQIDANGFTEAQEEFQTAENEVYDIEGEEGEKESRILKSGQKTTAMLTILLSMTIITMLFLLDTW